MNLLRRRFKIAHLIAEEFAGVITKENQVRLEQWRVESPAHVKEYDEIRTYIMTENERREKEKQTVKNEWRKFERVHFRKYVVWRRIGRCAAIMVMPLLVCGYFVSSEWKSSEVTIADNVEIVPGTGRAQLIMADGRFLKLEQKEDMKLDLPGVKVVATGKKIVYRAIEEETSTPKVEEYNTLVVPRGGEYMLELSDGTKVWLNSDSELRFPVTFVGDRRSVEIEGEAYFEVKKDSLHPFIVHTPHTNTKVLGTSFNVSAYEDEELTAITLVQGKVEVYNQNEKCILEPGWQAVSNNISEEMKKQQVNITSYVSWKEGMFEFYDMPLGQLIVQLSRWYDVDFFFVNETTRQFKFTGAIKRSNTLKFMLEFIEKTSNVYFKVNGNVIQVFQK